MEHLVIFDIELQEKLRNLLNFGRVAMVTLEEFGIIVKHCLLNQYPSNFAIIGNWGKKIAIKMA